MAHFVKLGTGNIVINGVVIHNNELLDETGIESEQKGIQFIESLYGIDSNILWKQTSYNTKGGIHNLGGVPLRKNYASLGGYYDPVANAFYEEQPYPSWTLNQDTFLWMAPIPRPNGPYTWNEENQTWDLYNLPK